MQVNEIFDKKDRLEIILQNHDLQPFFDYSSIGMAFENQELCIEVISNIKKFLKPLEKFCSKEKYFISMYDPESNRIMLLPQNSKENFLKENIALEEDSLKREVLFENEVKQSYARLCTWYSELTHIEDSGEYCLQSWIYYAKALEIKVELIKCEFCSKDFQNVLLEDVLKHISKHDIRRAVQIGEEYGSLDKFFEKENIDE